MEFNAAPKSETERLNRIQMYILIRNHGSEKAVKKHIHGVGKLIDAVYEKAGKTTLQPYVVQGGGGKALKIDPVSVTFHRLMHKAKKKEAGLMTY